MEAATLPKKKTFQKYKIKKTLIKNTLGRPDPVFWPIAPEPQAKDLEAALVTHKIDIPEFKKLPWIELKCIPKQQRPRPPKLRKVEGLIFGIGECMVMLKNKECSCVIIDSAINPRFVAQPIIEICISTTVPIVCLTDLKKISTANFRIPTCCLGIKTGFFPELSSKVTEISKLFEIPQPIVNNDLKVTDNPQNQIKNDEHMEQGSSSTDFTYLHRSSKNKRAFNPSEIEPTAKKAFMGQDFIEFSDKPEQKPHNKPYMNMILKKVTSNENRAKK